MKSIEDDFSRDNERLSPKVLGSQNLRGEEDQVRRLNGLPVIWHAFCYPLNSHQTGQLDNNSDRILDL